MRLDSPEQQPEQKKEKTTLQIAEEFAAEYTKQKPEEDKKESYKTPAGRNHQRTELNKIKDSSLLTESTKEHLNQLSKESMDLDMKRKSEEAYQLALVIHEEIKKAKKEMEQNKELEEKNKKFVEEYNKAEFERMEKEGAYNVNKTSAQILLSSPLINREGSVSNKKYKELFPALLSSYNQYQEVQNRMSALANNVSIINDSSKTPEAKLALLDKSAAPSNQPAETGDLRIAGLDPNQFPDPNSLSETPSSLA